MKWRFPEKPAGGVWNDVRFERVKSKKVRVVFIHQAPYKSGITEIAVWNMETLSPEHRDAAAVVARAKIGDEAGAIEAATELAAALHLTGDAPLGRRVLPLVRAQARQEAWAVEPLAAFWHELTQAIETSHPARPPAKLDGLELWWVDAKQQTRGKELGRGAALQLEGSALDARSIQWSINAETLAVIDDQGAWLEQKGNGREQVQQIAAYQFAISPDFSRYAICRREKPTEPTILIGGRGLEPAVSLGFGYDPAWFADGKRLAYLGWSGRWQLGIWDGTKSDLFDIPLHSTLHVYPTPSPDGRTIAFAMRADDGTRQIGIMRADGSVVRQVTRLGKLNTLPSFAPDGRLLALVRSRDDGKHDLRIIDLETYEETLAAEDVALLRPAWRRRPEK